MPRKELIFQNFLDQKNLLDVEGAINGLDVVIISYGSDFRCYAKANEKHQNYINNIFATQGGGETVVNFDHECLKTFPLIKCTGCLSEILKAKQKLQSLGLEIALLKEPFVKDYHIILITKNGVTKGSCISKILAQKKAKVIAAGNDGNDISMFDVADVSIAMKGSPIELLNKADIIAAPSKDLGIIEGLKEAIKRVQIQS
jgi:hydroxymethylpyrimidine pyrophosphatase-like HAD family hydrolase